VFASNRMAFYVERLCADILSGRALALEHGALVPPQVDTIYLGGGTPSLLPPTELTRLFILIANQFDLAPNREITVECAPGTLSQPLLESLVSCGVNRVSLGVQSFVDREAAAVGRLHKHTQVLEDLKHLRTMGIDNINIDLIAGLPHQTRESWALSLHQVIATGVPHVSVYMLEVDEDSRLGSELIAGGARYHAHFVPDEDLTADLYEMACEQLTANGIAQYEISNFGRAGFNSRHNLKYWTRQPYLGFGVDAHSMLPASEALREQGMDSLRIATTDSLDDFLVSHHCQALVVGRREALEESFFLGLRLNRGIRLQELEHQFGVAVREYIPMMEELAATGLLESVDGVLRLTPRGRLLSNEVFERFIGLNKKDLAGALSSL
jgi:oxygen-independent coproporphyrinogen-3 oxidase